MATQFSAGKVVGLLALFCLKSAFYTSLVATALELSPQMLNGGSGSGVGGGGGGGESNLHKSKEYTAFPLAQDVEVELPLDVNEALNAAAEAEAEEEEKQFLPPWLQMSHNEPPQQQQRISSGSAKAFIKMPPQSHQQHKQHGHGHTHTHSGSGSASSSERRCSIEISSKIPGVCQPMSHIGSACVSGEYMEVFNAECL